MLRNIVSARSLILPVVLTMFACGNGAEQELLGQGEAPPMFLTPDRMPKETINLRGQTGSGGREAQTVLYAYSAKFTNSATVATSDIAFGLTAGQTIIMGTCGVNGASGSGDTYLRLYNQSGTQVIANDNAAGCGSLSQFTYTVPANGTGTYTLKAGCAGSTSCSGTVGYAIGSALITFSASNTNSATNINTPGWGIGFTAGQIITLGTCGLPGAAGSGDTYLRFFDPNGVQVTSNDDACGGGLSQFTYTIPVTGTYALLTGCSLNTTCSGTVAYRLQ